MRKPVDGQGNFCQYKHCSKDCLEGLLIFYLPLRRIAALSLVLFCLAITSTAFGSPGCHCVADGLQGCDGYQIHPPHQRPHYDKVYTDLCCCDQLSCLLKSRTRVKREFAIAHALPQPVQQLQAPAPQQNQQGADVPGLFEIPSQTLVQLRTVVLLH